MFNKRITFFNEQQIGEYTKPKALKVFQNIQNIPDKEILKYRDDLSELVEKYHNESFIGGITISFENKQNEPYFQDVSPQLKKAYVKYTVTATGNLDLLRTCPYALNNVEMNVPCDLNDKTISFHLDTDYYNSFDFPVKTIDNIRIKYTRVKNFIDNTSREVNNSINHFNTTIVEHIKSELGKRLNDAISNENVKGKLDF